jgi:hypothetical protein
VCLRSASSRWVHRGLQYHTTAPSLATCRSVSNVTLCRVLGARKFPKRGKIAHVPQIRKGARRGYLTRCLVQDMGFRCEILMLSAIGNDCTVHVLRFQRRKSRENRGREFETMNQSPGPAVISHEACPAVASGPHTQACVLRPASRFPNMASLYPIKYPLKTLYKVLSSPMRRCPASPRMPSILGVLAGTCLQAQRQIIAQANEDLIPCRGCMLSSGPLLPQDRNGDGFEPPAYSERLNR